MQAAFLTVLPHKRLNEILSKKNLIRGLPQIQPLYVTVHATAGESRWLHLTLHLFLNLDTRVTGGRLREDWPHLGDAFGIFKEDNITLILNKLSNTLEEVQHWKHETNLAFPVDAVNFTPATRSTLNRNTCASKPLL